MLLSFSPHWYGHPETVPQPPESVAVEARVPSNVVEIWCFCLWLCERALRDSLVGTCWLWKRKHICVITYKKKKNYTHVIILVLWVTYRRRCFNRLTEFAVSNVWRGPVYVVALPRLIVVLEAPAITSHLRIRF